MATHNTPDAPMSSQSASTVQMTRRINAYSRIETRDFCGQSLGIAANVAGSVHRIVVTCSRRQPLCYHWERPWISVR